MLAQVIAICIFLGMFLLIILDQFERHIITLVSGALVLVLVFGLCMRSPATIWEALNLRSFFELSFWYQKDLSRISAAVDFALKNQFCGSCSKESQRVLTTILIKTVSSA